MQAQDFMDELNKYANDSVAISSQKFFKTGKGEYGEGDIFIGARVPDIRKVCKQFKNLPLNEVKELLEGEIHEHRLAAVIILRSKYQLASEQEKQQIYELYMQELAAGKINNWDIVDISCGKIVGEHNRNSNRDILYKLAKSKNIWERRVAIISTSIYIDSGEAVTALDIADILLHDQHDLIHKAVGWMLREVGKRVDENILTDYLEKNASLMPRTMLRYACEKLSGNQRNYYYNLKPKTIHRG
jgi:3-methyladenine DNA glycosylase AlkD